MLEHMKNEFNKIETENGDLAYKSTKSKVLDLFALGGAYRDRTSQDMVSLFSKAYSEDKQLAVRTLFYLRDIRGGQGERKFFREVLKELVRTDMNTAGQLIQHIPEYGRWDDMIALYGINKSIDLLITAMVYSQLKMDIDDEQPSLLAKWLPSENASSKETKRLAKFVMKQLEMTPKEYRKLLTTLRERIKIVETKITNQDYDSIEYDKVPSKASIKYRKAFKRNDEERYTQFIEDAISDDKPEVKIKASTLYPYEICEKVLNGNYDRTLEALWKNLPNYVKENENALVMADTSGSMYGKPIAVALSLALYFAEKNKGAFANHFMTFSERPELQEITGETLRQKFNNMERAHWDMNTNLNAAFRKILDVAVMNNVTQDELPQKLYVISDMQFDSCIRADKSTFQNAKIAFEANGYKLPEVVFWNVNARNNSVPVTMNEQGVQLVSGLSPVLFEQILSGLSAYDLMLKIVNGDRYQLIEI